MYFHPIIFDALIKQPINAFIILMVNQHDKTLATIIFSALLFGAIGTVLSMFAISQISSFDTRSLAKTNNTTANTTAQTMNLTVGQRVQLNCSGWNLQAQRKGRNQITAWCEPFPGAGGPKTSVTPKAVRPTVVRVHPTGGQEQGNGTGNETGNETENETENSQGNNSQGNGRNNPLTPTP